MLKRTASGTPFFVIANKRFIHSPAEKKAKTLRSSAGRVRKLDCGILVRDY